MARIAAGVDLYPEGRDAAVLGATLARVLDAELLLVAVHANPMVVLPSEVSWSGMHEAAIVPCVPRLPSADQHVTCSRAPTWRPLPT